MDNSHKIRKSETAREVIISNDPRYSEGKFSARELIQVIFFRFNFLMTVSKKVIFL